MFIEKTLILEKIYVLEETWGGGEMAGTVLALVNELFHLMLVTPP